MTILVLDEHALRFRRYAGWLADSGQPLVGFTRAGRIDRRSHPGFDRIQQIDGYAHTADLELAVLRLAATTEVTGIVATGFVDLLRAAALREFLGIRGQRRAGALAAVDLAVQRDLLAQAGIPVVPSLRVDHPAELCRQVSAIGHPVRLRRRRAVCWPGVARFDDRAQLIDFLARHRGGWRGLMVEPDVTGERLEIVWPPLSGSSVGPRGAADARELGAGVASALPDSTGPLVIAAVRYPDGGVRVDSVGQDRHDPALLRATVREQAGLSEMAVAS